MDVIRDIRITLRLMRANLRFTILALLVVASGITVSVFLFAMVNNTIDAPMPFRDGERLRRIDLVKSGDVYHGENLSIYEYSHLKVATDSLWQSFSLYARETANVSESGRAIRYSAALVTPTLFDISQAKLLDGRFFIDEDLNPSAENVAIIKEKVWQDFYPAEASVVGQSIKINGVTHTIIGVLPDGYGFPHKSEIWLPLRERLELTGPADGPGVTIYGMLKESVSDSQVNRQVRLAMEQLEPLFDEQKGRSAIVRTFQRGLIGAAEKIMLAMKVTVIFIMLLACTNIGNLMFARALERSRESAVRLALGAPKLRLVRQMVTESLVICSLAGVLSLILAYVWMHFVGQRVPNLVPFEIPMWWSLTLTPRDLLNTFVFVLVTAFLASLLPAWQVMRSDIRAALQDGGSAGGVSSGWMSRLVVVVEIILCSALLITAASFVHQVSVSNKTDIGLDAANVLTARVVLPEQTYTDDTQVSAYYRDVLSQISTGQNVAGVAATSVMPLDWAPRYDVKVQGDSYDPNVELPQANQVTVTPSFHDVLGINLVDGRLLNEFDSINSPLVGVVSESFAQRFWPQGTAIGQQITLREELGSINIVGVVSDVTFGTASERNKRFPTVYLSTNQTPRRSLSLLIKSTSDPYLLQNTLREATANVNAEIAAYDLISLEDFAELEGAGFSFLSELFVVFALVALVLAFSGIYAVMASSILKRTKEICIRRALGATDKNIYRYFFTHSAKLFMAGIIVGALLGWLIVDQLASGGQVKHQAYIYVLTISILIAVLAAAVLFPIKRVLAVEPQDALKQS